MAWRRAVVSCSPLFVEGPISLRDDIPGRLLKSLGLLPDEFLVDGNGARLQQLMVSRTRQEFAELPCTDLLGQELRREDSHQPRVVIPQQESQGLLITGNTLA